MRPTSPRPCCPTLGDGQTAWALVPNARGAELATAAGVDHLTITVSASEAYSAKNVHMTVAESLGELDAIRAAAPDAVLDLVVSFAFGSAFDDEEITPDDVLKITERAAAAGVDRATLADTTGVATPRRVGAVLDTVGTDVGLHLHDTRATALLNAWTAIERGVTRFDTAVGGLGGSPFAPSAGGNLATEDLVHLLADAGIDTGVDLAAVLAIGPRLADLVGHGIPSRVAAALGAVSERPRRACCGRRRADVWTATGRGSLRHRARLRRLRRAARLVGRPTSTAFWRAATEFTGVRWHDAPDAHARRRRDARRALVPRRHAQLRRARPRRRRRSARDDVAVIARSQTRDAVELTWAELAAAVAAAAAGLRRLGVGAGDRVVAYAPNIPETLVAFLAAASIGATWSSCAPEFGVRSVIDRFAQIEPAVLVAVDGYRYGTKDIDRAAEVAEITAALPTLRHVVHVPYLGPTGRRAGTTWAELVAGGSAPPAFTPVAADHPLYVLFSSGTTGLPEGDRPRPRRHRRRAPQGADAAPGPRPRRPLLLVHHDRLDDVELPRLGPADRVDDRAVRRRPGGAVARHAVGPRRRHRRSPCSACRRRS